MGGGLDRPGRHARGRRRPSRRAPVPAPRRFWWLAAEFAERHKAPRRPAARGGGLADSCTRYGGALWVSDSERRARPALAGLYVSIHAVNRFVTAFFSNANFPSPASMFLPSQASLDLLTHLLVGRQREGRHAPWRREIVLYYLYKAKCTIAPKIQIMDRSNS